MKKILMILSLAAALTLTGCWGKSDADLQKAAADAVKAKAPTVTVAVKDGVATLTGEVKSDADKAAAEAAAKVEGVKSVTNNITVKPPVADMASADDTTLKTKIMDALKKKNFTGVTVEVKGGVATLRGTYPKGKLADVMQAVNETKPGKVENQLTEAK